MSLKNYNNLLTSGRWSTKDPKDAQILDLVGLDQKIADDSKKLSEKSNTSNRDTTKGEPSYISDLPPWMLEETKGVLGNKTRMENNNSAASNTVMKKSSGSATIQKTTGRGPAPHQESEEALIHQAR